MMQTVHRKKIARVDKLIKEAYSNLIKDEISEARANADKITAILNSIGWSVLESDRDTVRIHGDVMHLLGQLARRNGDAHGALGSFLVAQSKYEEVKFLRGIRRNNSQLGAVSETLGLYDEAINYFQLALQGAKDQGDVLDIAGFNMNLGGTYRCQGRYDKAIACYMNAKVLFESLEERRGTYSVYQFT